MQEAQALNDSLSGAPAVVPADAPAGELKTVSTEIPAPAPAAEEPKKRTEEEIHQEFQGLIFKSGQIQHQILMLEQELGRTNAKITMVSQEAYVFEEARAKKAQADSANKAKQDAENKAKAEVKRAKKAGDPEVVEATA